MFFRFSLFPYLSYDLSLMEFLGDIIVLYGFDKIYPYNCLIISLCFWMTISLSFNYDSNYFSILCIFSQYELYNCLRASLASFLASSAMSLYFSTSCLKSSNCLSYLQNLSVRSPISCVLSV